MKKIILLLVILIYSWKMYSQELDRKYIIDFTGGFEKQTDEISMGGIDNEIENIGFKIKFDIYRKLNDFLNIGIGCEYQNLKQESKNSFIYQDDVNKNTFALINIPVVESKSVLPSVNLKFHQNITNKFSVGLNVINGYGFINISEEYIAAMGAKFPTSFPGFVQSNTENTDKTYYALIIEPEIAYYISDNLGFTAQLDIFKFDTMNNSQFFFYTKTNEISWSLGLIISIK
jgi:hypothetical protein